MINQSRFFLRFCDSPQKLIAIVICIIASFLFLREIIIFRSPLPIVSFKPIISKKETVLSSSSLLFTTPLFGQYIPSNLSEADIKKSLLDMEIVGILYANSEKDSQVIIRIGGGEQRSYGVGDVLPGGVILKQITEKGIIILHGGVLESLNLPANELIFSAPSKPLIEE